MWTGILGSCWTLARTSSRGWSGLPSVKRYTASASGTAMATSRAPRVLVLPSARRLCTHCSTAWRFWGEVGTRELRQGCTSELKWMRVNSFFWESCSCSQIDVSQQYATFKPSVIRVTQSGLCVMPKKKEAMQLCYDYCRLSMSNKLIILKTHTSCKTVMHSLNFF